MIKGLNLVLLVLALVGLAAVYTLKYQTETLADTKRALEADIARQNTNISVLHADWAYLTQPSYIAPLVERHAEVLQLQLVSAEQFGSIADLPMRPARPNDAALTQLFEALDAGIDPIGDKLAELLVNADG